jgi:hypothetical protein
MGGYYGDYALARKEVSDVGPALQKILINQQLNLVREPTFSLHPLSPEKKPPPWTKRRTGLSADLSSGKNTSRRFRSAAP